MQSPFGAKALQTDNHTGLVAVPDTDFENSISSAQQVKTQLEQKTVKVDIGEFHPCESSTKIETLLVNLREFQPCNITCHWNK